MITRLDLLWEDCQGLDHVPFEITFNVKAYQGTHQAIQKGTRIDTDALVELTENEANSLYDIVLQQCHSERTTMDTTDNCDTAHHMWSKICETYLLTWARIEEPADIHQGADRVAQ